jgi:hypothetical protein
LSIGSLAAITSWCSRTTQRETVTVPVHSGRDLKPGTLRSIIRQAGLSVEEFKELL